MTSISIATTMALTGWSERTIRRKLADGSITREFEASPNGNKSMIHLEVIKEHIPIPLEPDDFLIIKKADNGDAEAQNDVALMFLANDRPENAIYWLELASKQDYADAMHWLGRCYIEGNGVPRDDNLGIMWIANAAALGHVISRAQMEALRSSFVEDGGSRTKPS